MTVRASTYGGVSLLNQEGYAGRHYLKKKEVNIAFMKQRF